MPNSSLAYVEASCGTTEKVIQIKMRGNIQKLLDKKTVLLFYKEQENDTLFKHDRYLKRILRPIYSKFHHRQKKSGFATSFDLMCRALRTEGYDVRVNDYKAAKTNPQYPVGIVGFPLILKNWNLPNPAILGPSLYDHPMVAPDLMQDLRFKKYVVLGPWVMDIFKPVYGDACFSWFTGIDTKEWPDLSTHSKTYDFLIYDKMYGHEVFEKTLIQPILDVLKNKGLSVRRIRYKRYDHAIYKRHLSEARGMIFLCAHETQGLAYQEAMASGVPILAWNKGVWTNPLWKKFSEAPPPASSVPFFSPQCGETFQDVSEFEAVLDCFLGKRTSYTPRQYVMEHLSMKKSAYIYVGQYFSLIKH